MIILFIIMIIIDFTNIFHPILLKITDVIMVFYYYYSININILFYRLFFLFKINVGWKFR